MGPAEPGSFLACRRMLYFQIGKQSKLVLLKAVNLSEEFNPLTTELNICEHKLGELGISNTEACMKEAIVLKGAE